MAYYWSIEVSYYYYKFLRFRELAEYIQMRSLSYNMYIF